MQDEMILHVDSGSEFIAELPLAESQVADRWVSLQNGFWAIMYLEKDRAASVLKMLKEVHSPKLADLDDAVYVTRNKKGATELREVSRGRPTGVMVNSIVGLVVGMLLLPEIGGFPQKEREEVPAEARREMGKIHLQESFSLEVRERLQPSSSAIFLLLRKASPAEVIPRILPYGGSFLETSLNQEGQSHLQAAWKAARVH
jgi:uncharacterized membrane protein